VAPVKILREFPFVILQPSGRHDGPLEYLCNRAVSFPFGVFATSWVSLVYVTIQYILTNYPIIKPIWLPLYLTLNTVIVATWIKEQSESFATVHSA